MGNLVSGGPLKVISSELIFTLLLPEIGIL